MSMPIVAHIRAKSQSKGSARVILLNLAVYANDCCGLAWPSILHEAHDVNLNRRNLHYQHNALVAAGELLIHTGQGPRGTNLYQLAHQGVPLGALSRDPNVPHERGCPWALGGGAPGGIEGVPPGAPNNKNNERENKQPIARDRRRACGVGGCAQPVCPHEVNFCATHSCCEVCRGEGPP
jgi:hypothetical protein